MGGPLQPGWTSPLFSHLGQYFWFQNWRDGGNQVWRKPAASLGPLLLPKPGRGSWVSCKIKICPWAQQLEPTCNMSNISLHRFLPFLPLLINSSSLKVKTSARHLCIFPRDVISCHLGSKTLSKRMKEGETQSTSGVYYAEFGCGRLCSSSWFQWYSANSRSLVLHIQILTKKMNLAPVLINNFTRTKNLNNLKHLKPS